MYVEYLNILLDGLILGSMYSLIAVGLSLVFNVSKFINISHGIFVGLSSYVTYSLFNLLGINFVLSSVITVFVMVGLSVGLYYFYRVLKIKKTPNVMLLIVSFAVLVFVENLILLMFKGSVKSFGIVRSEEIILGIFKITYIQGVILLISAVMFLALWVFLKKTTLGKSIRAIGDNSQLAQVLGVDEKKIVLVVFVVGTIFCSVGGIFLGLEQSLKPQMGTYAIIKAFSSAVIGGLNVVYGTIFGGYFLGVIENFSVWFFSSEFKDAITYTLLFLFLLVRPYGIFGVRNRSK